MEGLLIGLAERHRHLKTRKTGRHRTNDRDGLIMALEIWTNYYPVRPNDFTDKMKVKQVLFIQGGGNGGYEADAALTASLQSELGSGYRVHYPQMLPDETMEDFAPYWLNQMDKEISAFQSELILAGHSLGASVLLKYLSENSTGKNITGIFLIAPPFWSGKQNWVQPLKLQDGFAGKLPKHIPIFVYHCKDDEVPFSHFTTYKQYLPHAAFREIENGGHQLDNDLSLVANDIRQLK
ncbi:MAG: alpha/beta hydrolase [Leadbetterella sp.]|nr:alpha/beta hydrolase [Leadbetterella sp.]